MSCASGWYARFRSEAFDPQRPHPSVTAHTASTDSAACTGQSPRRTYGVTPFASGTSYTWAALLSVPSHEPTRRPLGS